jgi:class 3 adenylate cyclase
MLSREQLAERSGVELDFVDRLTELGAIGSEGDPGSYGAQDVSRTRLLGAYHEAGLAPEGIVALVRSGDLSISWLETPALARVGHTDTTVGELCTAMEVELGFVGAMYEAIGFAPPAASDDAREGDAELLALCKALSAVGVEERSTLRMLRVYADSVRRMTKSEVELYEAHVEEPRRRSGRSERELLDLGARVGVEVNPALERAIVNIYRRHREHVWVEHSINHAEVAMERAGLFEKVPRPPAICFVDLTGYTRLTEEQGDEVAARLAASLATLVEDTSRRHGGQPIRWLGDGGMFHFKDSGPAVLAGLDMVGSAPLAGLPPMHIGIHTGPVIFQDGDVYGRTVNVASRIASYATAGQVIASEETMRRCSLDGVRFQAVGRVPLKGVVEPALLYRAFRA